MAALPKVLESSPRLQLKNILKPTFKDILIALFSCIPSSIILYWSYSRRNFQIIQVSQCSLLNTLAAKTFFSKIDNPNYLRYFLKNHIHLSQIFPLFPFIYRIYYILLHRLWKPATFAVIISFSFFSGYFFYRLLQCTRFVKKPLIPALIFTVFPIRSLYLKNTTNEYSCFTIVFSLIYISQQTKSFSLISLFSFLMVLTSDLGVFVVIGFIFSSIIQKRKKQFRYLVVGFISGIIVLSLYHKRIEGNYFVFFSRLLEQKPRPFKDLLHYSTSIQDLRNFHGLYQVFIYSLIACLMLLSIDLSLGIPLLLALLYASSKSAPKAVDSACPIEAMSIVLGFHRLFRHPRFHYAIYIIAPIYIIPAISLTCSGLDFRDYQSTHNTVYHMR